MDDQKARSSLEIIAGLMVFCGFSVAILGLPLGMLLGLEDYAIHHDFWSIAFGATLSLSCSIVGAILFWTGWAVVQRHWKANIDSQP